MRGSAKIFSLLLYSSQADFANSSFSPVSSVIFFISFLFMAFTNKVCGSKKSALAIPSESKHLFFLTFWDEHDTAHLQMIIFLSQSKGKSIPISFFQFEETIATTFLLQNVRAFKIKHRDFFHSEMILVCYISNIEQSWNNLISMATFLLRDREKTWKRSHSE